MAADDAIARTERIQVTFFDSRRNKMNVLVLHRSPPQGGQVEYPTYQPLANPETSNFKYSDSIVLQNMTQSFKEIYRAAPSKVDRDGNVLPNAAPQTPNEWTLRFVTRKLPGRIDGGELRHQRDILTLAFSGPAARTRKLGVSALNFAGTQTFTPDKSNHVFTEDLTFTIQRLDAIERQQRSLIKKLPRPHTNTARK